MLALESAVTFSNARCAEGSAMYSVLVRFHADGTTPEPRYLHRWTPPGCDGSSEIQELALYKDLCVHQLRHLCKGQDPQVKLEHLLQYPPLTGAAWFRPDMSSEQHALTFQAFQPALLACKGWDRQIEDAAEHRLRGAAGGPAPRG